MENYISSLFEKTFHAKKIEWYNFYNAYVLYSLNEIGLEELTEDLVQGLSVQRTVSSNLITNLYTWSVFRIWKRFPANFIFGCVLFCEMVFQQIYTCYRFQSVGDKWEYLSTYLCKLTTQLVFLSGFNSRVKC